MNNQLTQWEIDWAQDKLTSEECQVAASELVAALRDEPDSELYELALRMLKESSERSH